MAGRTHPQRQGPALNLELTTRCPHRCNYCYNVWKRPAHPEAGPAAPLVDPAAPWVPAAQLLPLVRRALAESGRTHLQLSGGEPLLHPEWEPFCQALRQDGVPLALVTSGDLIDAATASTLARLQVGPVQPTLLAASREEHDQLKGSACFDAIVAALGHLVSRRVPVSVAFVCTRQSAPHFAGVVELCFALGVNTLAFSRCCAAGEGLRHSAELLPTPEQLADCLDVAEWANARLAMHVTVAITLPLCSIEPTCYPHVPFGRCALGTEQPGYTLDAAGHLRGCAISPHVLGNLHEESFATIQARARQGRLAELTRLPEACTSCRWLPRCGGGCRESAAATARGWGGPDPLARLPR